MSSKQQNIFLASPSGEDLEEGTRRQTAGSADISLTSAPPAPQARAASGHSPLEEGEDQAPAGSRSSPTSTPAVHSQAPQVGQVQSEQLASAQVKSSTLVENNIQHPAPPLTVQVQGVLGSGQPAQLQPLAASGQVQGLEFGHQASRVGVNAA